MSWYFEVPLKTGWTVMVFTMKRVPWNGALLFPDYWQWTARPKYQRSSCATSKPRGRRCQELLQRATPWSFLLTFEWCRLQMMLISLNRNMAGCILRVVRNGQSMQQLPLLPDQRGHFGSLWASRGCNLKDGCDDANWSPPHVHLRFLPLIIPTYYMLLLRPFHEHICTVNNATSCGGGQDYLIIRND